MSEQLREAVLSVSSARDAEDPLVFSGRQVDDVLDLRSRELAGSVAFEDCTFHKPVRLDRVHAASLLFHRCVFEQGLQLTGAELSGSLRVDGGELDAPRPDHPALGLGNLQIGGAVVIAPQECRGTLALGRTVVDGALTLAGRIADIQGPELTGNSLIIRNLVTHGEVKLPRLTVRELGLHGVQAGSVNLADLRTGVLVVTSSIIENDLSAPRAVIDTHVQLTDGVGVGSNPNAWTGVDLDAVQVGGSILLRGCTIGQPLTLRSGEIRGDVTLDGCVLKGSTTRAALDAERARIDGSLEVRTSKATKGFALTSARVGRDVILELDITGRRVLFRPSLDLSYARIGGALSLGPTRGSVTVEGGVDMSHLAVVGDVTVGPYTSFAPLTGHQPALRLDGAIVGGALDVQGDSHDSAPISGISFLAASAARIRLRRPVDEPGLVADGVTVTGEVNIEECLYALRAVDITCEAMSIVGGVGSRTTHEARIHDAADAEVVLLDGAKVTKTIEISGDFLGPLRMVGGRCESVRFHHGRIGPGATSRENASEPHPVDALDTPAETPDDVSLNLGRVQCHHMTFTHFLAASPVDLRETTVTGELDLTGLHGQTSTDSGLQGRATVNLQDARVARLRVGTWTPSGGEHAPAPLATLDGATFRSILPSPPPTEAPRRLGRHSFTARDGVDAFARRGADGTPAKRRTVGLGEYVAVIERVRWITQGRRPGQDEGISPSAFRAVAEAYRGSGYDNAAVEVLMASEQYRRARGAKALRRFWNWLLRWVVGYGYRPSRSLYWLTGFWLLGSLILAALQDQFTDPGNSAGGPFNPPIYLLDQVLPFLSTGQDAYVPTGPALWVVPALVIVGWLLVTAVIAGVTTATRRGG